MLLIALVFFPTGTDWPMPGWLRALCLFLIAAGAVIVVGAGLWLGRALTPTPVPNGRGRLRTDGPYRFVRHPIYTGVLAIVVGITVGTRSWLGLALGVLTVAFFSVKARWEEARLTETFADYPQYARATPRFVPFLPMPGGRAPSGSPPAP